MNQRSESATTTTSFAGFPRLIPQNPTHPNENEKPPYVPNGSGIINAKDKLILRLTQTQAMTIPRWFDSSPTELNCPPKSVHLIIRGSSGAAVGTAAALGIDGAIFWGTVMTVLSFLALAAGLAIGRLL